MDVGVAVQFGDAGDVVLIGGVAGGAGAAVGVDDYLPLDVGPGGDGGGDVAPGGGAGAGVEVEGEEDEEGGGGEEEDGEGEEEEKDLHFCRLDVLVMVLGVRLRIWLRLLRSCLRPGKALFILWPWLV